MTPGPTGKFTRIKAGDVEEGDTVKVGGQSLRFDGTRIVPGVWKK